MGMTCVWAFQPLPELNNQLEFVECDDELAATLIAAGKAQDPRIGGTALNYVTDKAPAAPKRAEQTYDTKVMTPKQPPRNDVR